MMMKSEKFNDDEIRKVAMGIKEKIEKEKLHQEEYNSLKKQLEESLPFLREKFLNELLLTTFDADEANKKMDYFGVRLLDGCFQTAIIEIEHTKNESEVGEEEHLLVSTKATGIVKQFFRDDDYVYVFQDNRGRTVILCTDSSVDLVECCEQIKNLIINRLKCFACIGVGGRYEKLYDLRKSFKEAGSALNYKVIVGKNQVIHYYDINVQTTEKISFDNEQAEALSFYIKAGVKDKAEELIVKVFGEKNLGKNFELIPARVIASDIVSVVLKSMSEIGLDFADVPGADSQPYGAVFSMDTLPDMKDYIKQLVLSTMEHMRNFQTKRTNSLIKSVKEYLVQNLTNSELTMAEVAKVFYLNQSYLSRIFRQETGQTLVEYLTRIRMEKASKLLKETDLKAYQIAEEVGITDPHYFAICLKKYTGVSINDYRKG